jgi:hypothetical protein
MGLTGKSNRAGSATGQPPEPTGGVPTGGADDAPVSLSWQENELVNALKRVANARSQLVTLEAEAAVAAKAPHVSAADAAALTANHAQLVQAQAKARGRLGGGAARKRLPELEATEARLLRSARMATYDDFEAWRLAPNPEPTVDLALLDFARREVTAASNALAQIQSLELPDVEPDELDDEAVAAAKASAERPRLAHPEAS